MKRAKNLLEVIFYWLNRNIVITLLSLFLVAGTASYLLYSENSTSADVESFITKRSSVQEVVTLTGTVKPSQEANLTFEKAGVVKDILVKVGDVVKEGDVLASISIDDSNARVLEAQANLASARSSLQDLQTGSRVETVNIKQAALQKTESDIEQGYKNAFDSVKNLSIYGNTFVRDNLSSYFSGNLSDGYKINVMSCDSQKENDVVVLKVSAELALKEIEKIVQKFGQISDDQADVEFLKVKEDLTSKISSYLVSLKDLFSTGCLSTNSNYDSARSTILTSRNTWSSLTADLSTKMNLIENSKVANTQAKNDLVISQGGEKNEKLSQLESQVLAAKARLAIATSEDAKKYLLAPFDGIVTNIEIKKGELASVGGNTISLISASNYQLESKVSEIDVAKLQKDLKAIVTFDAYGDAVTFDAFVSSISLAGVISEGVPTYKTIFDFNTQDEKIRSGMTANIKVITSKKDNVISVPAKFIQNKAGQKYVNVLVGNDVSDFIETNVKTGVVGVNGEVEILGGLDEGKKIVVNKN